MSDRWGEMAVVLLAVLCCVQARAQASGPAPAGAGANARVAQPVCVDAEIDGARALSYDCLSRQLAAPKTGATANAASSTAEGLASAPSNRVGTFNESAESIRFGSNWGKSAFPQRPPQQQAVPLGR